MPAHIDIATWNVNSVKARLPTVLRWVDEAKPDVICLQEIKCVDEAFPSLEFEDRGYTLLVHGQKSYNGVAIATKLPVDEFVEGLPGEDFPDGDEPDQARYLEAVLSHPKGAVRVATIYMPNGNPVGSGEHADGEHPKYRYKLRFMERLRARAEELLKYEEVTVLGGDYNVIPGPGDVHDPDGWWGDALYRQETLDAYRALLALGLYSAVDQMDGAPGQYTFWDYQGGAWPRNHGIRIDHLLGSPQAADCLESVRIDRHVRDWAKPSDHVPVVGRYRL